MKKFKKDDFYSGMRVTTKNGNEYIIVESSVLGIIGVRENNWLMIGDDYNEDLATFPSDGYTIMKVYDAPYSADNFLNIDIKGTLLWERDN